MFVHSCTIVLMMVLDVINQVSHIVCCSPAARQHGGNEGAAICSVSGDAVVLCTAGTQPQLPLHLKHLSLKLAPAPRNVVLVQSLHLTLEVTYSIRSVPEKKVMKLGRI